MKHTATITRHYTTTGKQRYATVKCSCGWSAGGCSFGTGMTARAEWIKHIPAGHKKGSIKYIDHR